ncbi:hypothetical protein [Streptomyces sp. NPDC018045]|uniref:hypothetical protein n=1 Tax=Streptomyces sp. NPDC018045 TaxID=3365037 RepID=UPI0037AA1172
MQAFRLQWGQGRAEAGLTPEDDPQKLFTTACLHGLRAKLSDALDQLMRRIHSGHATTPNKPSSPAPPQRRSPPPGTPTTPAPPAQHDEDDSIDELDGLPDDDTHPAAATGCGLYDAHEEAAKW